MFFYFLVMAIAFVFFSTKIIEATAKPISPKEFQVLDVSQTNITPENITKIKPSPFFIIEGIQPPSLPAMPKEPGQREDSNALTVTGCIPPNIVILQKNNKTLTAKTGETTWMGVVGRVYIDGAWINNEFVPIKK